MIESFDCWLIAVHDGYLSIFDCSQFPDLPNLQLIPINHTIIKFVAGHDCLYSLRHDDVHYYLFTSSFSKGQYIDEKYPSTKISFLRYSSTNFVSFNVLFTFVFCVVSSGLVYIIRKNGPSSFEENQVLCIPRGFEPMHVLSTMDHFLLYSSTVDVTSVDQQQPFCLIIDMIGSKLLASLKAPGRCLTLRIYGQFIVGNFHLLYDERVMGIYSIDKIIKKQATGRSSVISKGSSGQIKRVSVEHLRLVPKTLKTPLPLLNSVHLPKTPKNKNKRCESVIDITRSKSANRLLKKFDSLR
ncbi:hypothetical protein GEMRC1_006631 [Eukaryota sp. GEM-RC1]